VDLNATQAAIRAGYSEHTAEQQGSRLLRNAQVKAAVDALTAKRAERLELSADKVLKDLNRLGELAEAFGDFAPAIKARELLGKHLGLFPNKHELAGAGGEGLTVVVQSLAEPKKGTKK
jgi:hypothetical protein